MRFGSRPIAAEALLVVSAAVFAVAFPLIFMLGVIFRVYRRNGKFFHKVGTVGVSFFHRQSKTVFARLFCGQTVVFIGRKPGSSAYLEAVFALPANELYTARLFDCFRRRSTGYPRT